MRPSGPNAQTVIFFDCGAESAPTFVEALRTCGFEVLRIDPAEEACWRDRVDCSVALVRLDSLRERATSFITKLRTEAIWRDVFILAITQEEPLAIRALQAGADDFLLLPVANELLAARIQLLMRHRHAMMELRTANDLRIEQARTLVALLDLSAVLSSCDSLDEVLNSIITTVTGLIQARHAAILMPDAHSHELIATAVAGSAPLLEKGQRLPADRGVIATALRNGTITPLRRGEPGGIAEDSDDERPIIGVCIPLRSSSQPDAQVALGVMYLSWRKHEYVYNKFTDEMLELIGNLAAVAIEGALARFWRDEARDSLVLALVELAERRDNDTARHLDRVTAFSVLLADELRKEPRFAFIDDLFIEELRRSAPLHDIGKVAIPDSILLKPGKLTVPEMEIMKTHTLVGAEAIRTVRKRLPNSAFGQMAEDIARHHHERFDGTGYPYGLAGDAIPLAARIVAIADVYDALTTERPYKKSLSHEEAMQIIAEGAGTHFDERLVNALLRRGEEFREFARKLSDSATIAEMGTTADLPMHWYLHAKTGSFIATPTVTPKAGKFMPAPIHAPEAPSRAINIEHAPLNDPSVSTR